MKYSVLFQEVKKQVDAIDVYGLLAIGSPGDEFDIESEMITARLRIGMTPYSIAEIIAEVMNKQFDKNFGAIDFISYAEKIEKVLNNN